MDTTKSYQNLVAKFSKANKAICVNFRELVPSFSPNRATHQIHPYPAKLLSHIPAYFLSNKVLSKPGDTVLDPFSGSGTVLLEAILSGRNAIGFDINPISKLISKTKTHVYKTKSLLDHLEVILKQSNNSFKHELATKADLKFWFYPHIIRELEHLYGVISKIKNRDIRDFYYLCLSCTIRKVSLADPRISVPVKLNPKKYNEGHWLRIEAEKTIRRLKRINTKNFFRKIALSAISKSENLCGLKPKGRAIVLNGDARNTSLPSNSIQLIITSPPYAGAQKYMRSMRLSINWLALSTPRLLARQKSSTIGREEFHKKEHENQSSIGLNEVDSLLGKIYRKNPLRAHIAATYLIEMRSALTEAYRVLKPDGHLILISANNRVCGKKFETSKYLSQLAVEVGFSIELALIDKIKAHGLMTKRNKTASIISQESIVVFKKGAK